MIVSYEGLPRMDRSYTSVIRDILDALKIGWHVVTNVAGFNLETAAELLEKAVDVIRELVKVLTDEEVVRIHGRIVKDTLCVLGEEQDYRPSNFKPLDKATTKFVTQHGHGGIDITLMGQGLSDLHNIWKRRVDQKYVFQKKDITGEPNKFKWTTYEKVRGQKGDRSEKISDSSGCYEERYFGLHKSHTDGTTNTDTLEDSSVNVLKAKVLRVRVPLFALVVFGAIGFLVYLFKDGSLVGPKPGDRHVVTKTVVTSGTPPTLSVGKVATTVPVKALDTAAKPVPKDDDFIAKLTKGYRPHLEGRARVYGQADIIVAWYDDPARVCERLSTAATEDFGWRVQEPQYGQHVILTKDERRIVVTTWSIDIHGRVPERQAGGVRAMSGVNSRAARDERMQDFGSQGWRMNDDRVMGWGVVNLPPSVVNILDDTALPWRIRRNSTFDGTQHWPYG